MWRINGYIYIGDEGSQQTTTTYLDTDGGTIYAAPPTAAFKVGDIVTRKGGGNMYFYGTDTNEFEVEDIRVSSYGVELKFKDQPFWAPGWQYEITSPATKAEVPCECGSSAVGSTKHSNYCPKHEEGPQ
jgi:hypothetical protein